MVFPVYRICNLAHHSDIEQLDMSTLFAGDCNDIITCNLIEFVSGEVEALIFTEWAVRSTIAA